MPTVTLLEFSSLDDVPAKVKVYGIGSIADAIEAEAETVTEISDPEADETKRYEAAFTGLPVADYQMVAFNVAGLGIVHEKYTTTDGGRCQPWREFKPLVAADVSVAVSPYVLQQRPRVQGTTLSLYLRDRGSISLTVIDATKAPVDVSSETLELVVAEYSYDSATDELTETILATVASADLWVSGADDNVVTFATPADAVARLGHFSWSLRRSSNGFVFGAGDWAVTYAPGGTT